MVGHFVELLNPFDVGAYDSLLLFKHSDRSVDLNVHEALVVEILQGDRHLVFSLLVEDDFEAASVIVDFKEGTHGLLLLSGHTAHNNDLVDGVTIDLADIVRSGLSLLNHLQCDRGKDAVLSALLPAKISTTLAILHVAACFVVEAACSPAEARSSHVLSWVEETCILTREHC